MSPLTWPALIALALAAPPAGLFLVNLLLFRRLPQDARAGLPSRTEGLSVLIPARNEAGGIADAVQCVLANAGVDFEVIVLDDHSTDDTAAIVADLAERDPRVRLATAPPLPDGWCGKQHACHVLAGLAAYESLVFIDADVRLAPDALVRFAGALDRGDARLISGFPRQVTRTLAEKLLIPLMHVVLLGYLPLIGMRRSTSPVYAAGCGQLMITRLDDYRRAGGHAAIRASRHDGIKLPRAYRRAGLMTEVFDATDTASCRMYRGWGEVWRGLAKNADEGLGSAGAIGPWTLMLGGGQVMPAIVLAAALSAGVEGMGPGLAAAATAASYLPRLLCAWRFRQSWIGAALHPLGVGLLLAVQYHALLARLRGRRIAWKDRPV